MTRDAEIQNYYDNLASTYDENRFDNSYGTYIHEQEESILGRFLMKEPLKDVLSLACGTGRFMEYATQGLDFSEKMMAIAKEKFPNKTFTISEASNTGLEDNSFESVFSLHLFMHLEKKLCRKILTEMLRISKPGGRFIFDFPSAKRRKYTRPDDNNWHGSTHFTMDELSEYLDGWRIIHREGVLFLPIHRFPTGVRKFFRKVDTLLCKSFLKDYASYTVLVLEKK